MYFFRSAQLHSRNDCEPDGFSDTDGTSAILTGVVVGQCYYIKTEELCHIDKIVRSHVIVTAGGQARMCMKIVI